MVIMRNKLLTSFILIFLAGTGRSEENASTVKNNGAFIISAGSLQSACNQKNIYSSYQFCDCDESCWQKDNCCPDDQHCEERQYKEDELTCVNTLQGDVYMVNTCLPDVKEFFRNKCQTTNESELIDDYLLTVPVTTPQNITYRNLFCAYCNNVPAYVIWNVALRCELHGQNLSNVNITSLLKELQVDAYHPQLLTTVNNTDVRCSTQAYLPSAWAESVRFCGPSKGTGNCPICQPTSSDKQCVNTDVSKSTLLAIPLRNSDIPSVREDVYTFIYENPEALSVNQGKKRKDVVPDVDACFPKKNNLKCERLFANNGDFDFIDNETIFVNGQFNASFDHTHWNLTLTEGVIHFCVDKITLKKVEKPPAMYIMHILDMLSVICLIAFFAVMYSDKESKLQNLTYKIICSFSITLLALYVVDRLPVIVICNAFVSATSHYLYLSLCVWMLIAAYDFWRTVCLSPGQYQIVGSTENHFVRYLAYSLTGWIAPLAVIFIALYFDVAPIDTIPCDLKPAYGRTESCFIEQEKPLLYLYSYPFTVVFAIAAVFFVYTSYRVRTIRRESRNSVAQNEFFNTFKKMSFIMWFFVLDILWMYTNNELLHYLYFFATAILGIFIFFAFAFEKRMISNVIERIQK